MQNKVLGTLCVSIRCRRLFKVTYTTNIVNGLVWTMLFIFVAKYYQITKIIKYSLFKLIVYIYFIFKNFLNIYSLSKFKRWETNGYSTIYMKFEPI